MSRPFRFGALLSLGIGGCGGSPASLLRLLEATRHFDVIDEGALLLHTVDGATIKAHRE